MKDAIPVYLRIVDVLDSDSWSPQQKPTQLKVARGAFLYAALGLASPNAKGPPACDQSNPNRFRVNVTIEEDSDWTSNISWNGVYFLEYWTTDPYNDAVLRWDEDQTILAVRPKRRKAVRATQKLKHRAH